MSIRCLELSNFKMLWKEEKKIAQKFLRYFFFF